MRFEILGPQRAWLDNRELDLGPGKQRAVLAVLLLHAGRPVPTARIVDAVWADDPPANGPNVVQKYVAGLRRILEPDRSPRTPGQVLSLTDAGYLLRVGPDDVDALRFEQRTRRAQVARAEGRWHEAVGELRAALTLWRGEPFEDLTGSFFDSARHRLAEARTTAVETWADLELQLGNHQEVVGELARLVPQFPVRERLRYLLMLALYRAGRQAEALTAFREIRSLLRDEHGLEPGEQLQELHRRMLRSDPTLTLVAPDAAPAARPVPLLAAPPGPTTTPTTTSTGGPVTMPVTTPTGGPVTTPVTTPMRGPVTMPVRESAGLVGHPPNATVREPAGPGPLFHDGGALGPPFPFPPLTAGHGRKDGRRAWLSNLGTVLGVLTVLASFGCLTWLVMVAYSLRRHSGRLALAGLGYLAAVSSFFILVATTETGPGGELTDAEGVAFIGMLLVTWVGGTLHLVLISRAVRSRLSGRENKPGGPADAERRMRREQARYLLYHYPAARTQLWIGRPDLPHAFDDGGLVDINAVGEQVVLGLPGLSAEQSRQILLDRWLRGPYASLEEMVARCLLPMNVADALREILVFLPPLAFSDATGPAAPGSTGQVPPAFPARSMDGSAAPSAKPAGSG